jgi:hypothetical protein
VFTPAQTEQMIRLSFGVRVRYAAGEATVETYAHRDIADGTALEELERQGIPGVKAGSDLITVATGILPAAALVRDAVLQVETAPASGVFDTRWVRASARLQDGGETVVALALPR